MKLFKNPVSTFLSVALLISPLIAKEIKSLRGKEENSKEDIKRTLHSGQCHVDDSSWIGDGYCDKNGGYNTNACNYDGGDCCPNRCYRSDTYECGVNGYNCLDPRAKQCNTDEGETWCETLQSCIKKWITQCPATCDNNSPNNNSQCKIILGGCGNFGCKCIAIGVDDSWAHEDQCPPEGFGFCRCAGCAPSKGDDFCSNTKAVCHPDGYCDTITY